MKGRPHGRNPAKLKTPGRQHSREAERHIGDDLRLKAQILNNLCFYYLEVEPRAWMRLARTYYDQLVEVQETLEPNRDLWAPNFVDTILWAQFKLGLQSDLKKLVAAFERLLKRTDESEQGNVHERLTLVRHAARHQSARPRTTRRPG